MPRVKIDYVVSFSSEDPDHPASNLLAEEISRRRWVCGNKGEASCSVVLQLVRSVRISAVHVGSHDSALVEVLVGRSETPQQPYQVLVLSSLFMSPVESKKGPGVSKVRTFSEQQLAADARSQCWDRVRVVCLQPYNKHVQYGLSFIHIFEPETVGSEAPPLPAPAAATPPARRFQIRTNSSDDDESFKPGELFAKMQSTSTLSVDAQIRQASKPSALKHSSETTKAVESLPKTPSNRDKSKNSDQRDPEHIEMVARDRDSLIYKDEEKPNDRIDKIMKRDREHKENNKLDDTLSNAIKQKNKENHSRRNETKNQTQQDKCKTPTQESKHKNESISKHNENSENTSGVALHGTSKHREKDRSRENGGSNVSEINKTGSNERKYSDKGKNTERRELLRPDSSKRKESDRSEPSSSKRSSKRAHSREKHTDQPSKRLRAGPRSSSPHRLLADVVFVLSGYENPRRGALRDRALACGARYKRDWGPGCTHLICAFPNTPKLRAVRSSDDRAIIVRGEWVEECCRERRLVPWQWHATEPERRRPRDEPDTSDHETPLSHSEECDTDDEIQKILEKQKNSKPKPKSPETKEPGAEVKRKCSTSPSQTAQSPSERAETPMKADSSHDSDVTFLRDERIQGKISLSDSETDSYTDEEESIVDTDAVVCKDSCLPDFFEGYTFAIDPHIQKGGFDVNLLKRYVTAYSGEIVEHIHDDTNVDYVLSLSGACELRRMGAGSGRGSGAVVRPDWVWRCSDNKKKVSTKDFLIK